MSALDIYTRTNASFEALFKLLPLFNFGSFKIVFRSELNRVNEIVARRFEHPDNVEAYVAWLEELQIHYSNIAQITEEHCAMLEQLNHTELSSHIKQICEAHNTLFVQCMSGQKKQLRDTALNSLTKSLHDKNQQLASLTNSYNCLQATALNKVTACCSLLAQSACALN